MATASRLSQRESSINSSKLSLKKPMTLVVANVPSADDPYPRISRPFMIADTLTSQKRDGGAAAAYSRRRRKIHKIETFARIPDGSGFPKTAAKREQFRPFIVGQSGNALLSSATILEFQERLNRFFLSPRGKDGWKFQYIEEDESLRNPGEVWEREDVPVLKPSLLQFADLFARTAESTAHEAMDTFGALDLTAFYSNFLLLGYCEVKNRHRLFELVWKTGDNPCENKPRIELSEVSAGRFVSIGSEPARVELAKRYCDSGVLAQYPPGSDRLVRVIKEIIDREICAHVGGGVLFAAVDQFDVKLSEIGESEVGLEMLKSIEQARPWDVQDLD